MAGIRCGGLVRRCFSGRWRDRVFRFEEHDDGATHVGGLRRFLFVMD
jgi:hypothetical protein